MSSAQTLATQDEAPQTIDAAVVPTSVSSPFPRSDVRARGEMKPHSGISSLAHLGSALGVRFNIGHNTGGIIGAQDPRHDPLARRYPGWTVRSPWLDPSKSNLFKDEFQIAREDLPSENFKPLEIYSWIERHGGERLFFKGLARLAPMFPVIAYHDQVAVWTSPPPSGFGNAIFMVMGHDTTGQLRLVGGNYFTEPTPQTGLVTKNVEFFDAYDRCDDYGKRQLVRDTIRRSISAEDEQLLRCIEQECEHFHTMAIYITILTQGGSLFHAAKAVIEGSKTADFSYEHFGEVK
jgi:hypothetical protein